MLVIFPFEEQFYRDRGVAAEFVGHPLADLAAPEVTREAFARQHGLDASKPWVALLPGSRQREVYLNLPAMLEAAEMLGHSYEYLVPVAPTLPPETVPAIVQTIQAARPSGAKPVPAPTLVSDPRAALYHARGSVVASGTATVEAALLGNPFVVVYRLSKVSYAIARRFVRVPHVAMANLIAGRRLVPELIQHDFTAANVVEALRPLLAEGPAREEMMTGLREVRGRLDRSRDESAGSESAIDRAARICVGLLAEGAAVSTSNAAGLSATEEAPEHPAETAGMHRR
jgi:lipid-A-disaccharide synthase